MPHNIRMHLTGFTEATEVFGDDYSSAVDDPDHSAEEVRYLIFDM